MNESQVNGFGEVEFHYPRKPWVFVLCCYLVILGLVTVFCFGKIPLQYLAGFGAFYLFYISINMWDWPARLTGAGNSIILGVNGIRIGKKFAAWDNIEEIKPGIWPLRACGIRFKLKKQKRPFFEFTLRPKPKTLSIPAYPFVYRELIPAILAIRPDLPVSPIVIRAMADPENSIAPRRWLLTLALLINIGLLTALFMPQFHYLIAYLFIGLLLGLVEPYLRVLAAGLFYTDRDKFIEFSLSCPIVIIFFAGLYAFSQIEHIAMETIVSAAITASVLGLVLLFAKQELTKDSKVFILCILAGVPAGTYAYQKSQEWPARDITGRLCGKEAGVSVWGSSGRYITSAWHKGQGCVIDSETLKQNLLPIHDGAIKIIWMDDRFVIRRMMLADESNDGPVLELWVYDFNQQKEFKMPASQRFSVGGRRPVDYTGQHLAWVDYGQEGENLRFWNLETMKEDIESRQLPKDVNWTGGRAAWTGDKELAVYVQRANKDCEEKQLFVLRMNLENGQQRLISSKSEYQKWYPTGDFKNAFGVNSLKDERFSVVFVDLQTDQEKLLAGEGFPLEASESKCAFHIVEEKKGSYLKRFDYVNSEDEQLCRVPRGMSILGVSPTGRYALVSFSEFLRFPVYVLVDVSNNKKHWIHLTGFCGGGGSPELTASMPGASYFSADERRLLLETLEIKGGRTFLIEIPEKW